MSDFKVIVRNNGPLRLEGEITLLDQDGKAFGLAGRTVVSLCRCGQSQNKPFCDGTHNKVGFDGAETADTGPIAGRRDDYDAAEVTIHDDRSVCAHAGECTDRTPSVWRLNTEPWIDPAGATAGGDQVDDPPMPVRRPDLFGAGRRRAG